MHNKNNKLKIKNICIMNNRGRQYYFLQINQNYKVWFQQTFSLDTNLEDIIKIRDQVLEDLKNEKLTPKIIIKKKEKKENNVKVLRNEKLTPIRDIKKKEKNNMIKKRHQFIYTKNINKPEYNFYQDSKNEDFKVYEYLLETNFENDEYREFYEYFKNLYHISDRLFKFIIEELKNADCKEFGNCVLVDFKDAPKYERFIPDNSLEIGKSPKELPRNVQIISGKYLVKIMIDKVIFKQKIDLKTPIETVIKVRDEMRKKERLLKDFEMEEILK